MEIFAELTAKQKRVLDFIREMVRQNRPPTIREIGRKMGFSSTGTVRDYLKALEEKGYIKRTGHLSRSIELLRTSFKIPILASIPAGPPNLAYEDIEGYVDADDLFLGRLSDSDVFALKIKGESMREAGIMEGDIAIIKKQRNADSGDIIAALLNDNETTLKRLKYKGKRPFLEAANKDYQPLYKEFSVIGKVITILRKYR
ncbi:transcriptional repressor LexA [Candidatus Omnitrophota bacterium]